MNMKAMALLFLILSTSQVLLQQKPVIDVIKIDGTINPAATDYIHEGIKRAYEENAECLVIQMNTPGGLLKSTRIIVSDILTSKIPVVVFIYPSGSQAASAGVFITLAADISVMAPGTNIGAAHPVMMTEGETPGSKDSLDVMMTKATNDAAAFARTIAEKRHRNIDWAEKAVRKSLSLTETEALKENVIDFIARDMNNLLNQLDGRIVVTAAGSKIIHTANAEIRIKEMSTIQKILDIISDPNLAYIFLMLGFYGLLFELYNPGSILPGIVGVISLILAFYSLHSLPINYAGLALIIFAIILFVAELKIVSHGLLTAGGILSLLIGSLMLINTGATFRFAQISLSLIITVTILTTLFFIFALGKGIAAQRIKPKTGSEGLMGELGIVISKITSGSTGQIMVRGEIWKAECEEEINSDENVEVIDRKDLLLKVKKV
jgi:membrane-bound serine protease (ClpP class)